MAQTGEAAPDISGDQDIPMVNIELASPVEGDDTSPDDIELQPFEIESEAKRDGGVDRSPRPSAELVTTFAEVSQRVSSTMERIKSGKPVQQRDVTDLKRELDMDEHKIDIEDLCARLETNIEDGLAPDVAAKKLEFHGLNQLTPPQMKPEWRKFLEQLTDRFSLLLWVGAILSFVGYGIDSSGMENFYIGCALAFVVTVTGVFSYMQERKSSKIMEKFKTMLPDKCTVIRGGEPGKIEVTGLVVGDIVDFKGGDKIPADVRLIEVSNVKVNNSSLTGEAEAQSRSTEMTDENPLETKNLAFYSTLVTEGSGRGVVIFTGDDTVIGRIAGLAMAEENPETPIHKEIKHFIAIISGVAIVLGVTFFIFGFFVGQTIIYNIVFMIGIIVANVPEGLLATVAVSLTLTANRMATKNVLVKNLESVETLGSTSVICSDKTGTLTQNLMTAAHVWYDGQVKQCHTSVLEETFERENVTFKKLARCAVLCNRAKFATGDEIIGDASETALLKLTAMLGRDVMEWRDANRKLSEIPFNSMNKFQVSIHKQEDGSPKPLVVMKGAPERVFARCDRVMQSDGEVIPMSDEQREAFEHAYDTLGGMGERVMGFCEMELDEKEYPLGYDFDTDNVNFPMDGFVFLGLFSLIDPPRTGVCEAVGKCKAAGIKVVMVTGDHPITAKAIARDVGIMTEDCVDDIAKREGIDVEDVDRERAQAVVVHGSEMKDLVIEDWDYILSRKNVVFARTSPQQKLAIVENFQRRRAVVAVTGDGVNDSPALKKADIGVSMGIAGSDVSKEAADMILLDDNFASIVNGVEEGRLIFDNLKKSIAYTLSSNIPEIAPYILWIGVGLPLPLTTILILCVDLGTDLVPAISMAYERAEADIMQRPPRNAQTDNLVTSRLISFSYLQIGIQQALAGLYTYFVVLGDKGMPITLLPFSSRMWVDSSYYIAGKSEMDRFEMLAHAQTAYFISIIVVQWADLLICKTRSLSIFQQGMKNNHLTFGLFFETALGCFLAYVPFVNMVFGTRPISFFHWLPGLPFSLLIFTYDELRKWAIRRNRGGFLELKTYY